MPIERRFFLQEYEYETDCCCSLNLGIHFTMGDLKFVRIPGSADRAQTLTKNWVTMDHRAGSATFSEHVAFGRRTITTTSIDGRAVSLGYCRMETIS